MSLSASSATSRILFPGYSRIYLDTYCNTAFYFMLIVPFLFQYISLWLHYSHVWTDMNSGMCFGCYSPQPLACLRIVACNIVDTSE
jgi:hypothetical protein